jgi:hypothetical protein
VLTSSEVTHALGLLPVRTRYDHMKEKVDVGRGAHLAVYLTRGVKVDHINDYSQKSGHARQGVALYGGKIRQNPWWNPQIPDQTLLGYRPI